VIVPFLGTLAVGLGLWIPPQPPGPYDDTNTGSPEEARALIEAMAVNDAALWAMEWEQRTLRWNGTEWEPAEESRQAFQYDRWAMRQTVHMPDLDEPLTHARRFDGVQMLTMNLDTLQGSIRPVDPGDRDRWGTPLKYLGRRISRGEPRTVAQILADAEDLRVREGDEPSIRVVSGFARVARAAMIVEAALDTSRGFCPVRITLFDGRGRWPVAQYQTTALARHGGAWVPVGGVESYWVVSAEDGNDPRWAEFRRLVPPREEGDAPPDPADPAVRRAYRDAVRSAFGPSGIPVESLVPAHRLEVTAIRSANTPIAPREFSTEPPEEALWVVDGLRLRSSNGVGVVITP
jgi:hypothetical protein